MAYPPVPFDPGAPYGRDPQTGLPYSDRSRTLVGLLQLLLPCIGACGIGRLLTGHTAIGVVQLVGYLVSLLLGVFCFVTLPVAFGLWVWSIVDGILMLTGRVRDVRGLPLRP